MKMITEAVDQKSQILIVTSGFLSIAKIIQEELLLSPVDVFLTSVLPKNLTRFHYIILLGDKILLNKVPASLDKKIILITFRDQNKDFVFNKQRDIKIIDIKGTNITKKLIDRILWFAFSRSHENYLRLDATIAPGKKSAQDRKKSLTFHPPGKKQFLFLLLIFIFFIHIAFSIPLISSSFLAYKSVLAIKEEKFAEAEKLSSIGQPLLVMARVFYLPVRPTFLFFSLALSLDTFLELNEKTHHLTRLVFTSHQNSKEIVPLLFKKNKTEEEKEVFSLRLKKMKQDFVSIKDDLQAISRNLIIPGTMRYKKEITSTLELMERYEKFLPQVDDFLAKEGKRKYLVLFANNRELRPGGGFIGSFGVLTMEDMTFQELKVYDVYDADGQLKVHYDPPEPIRTHLGQPHWFLRDSAFSADFFENYEKAKFFLEKEMGFTDFDGGILLTSSAIENILAAYGNLELPDFKESVTKKNFYIKAQINAEARFFPGSTAKKNFLGSVARQILIQMDQVSTIQLIKEVKKSFDEKQMVAYFENPKIQNILDSLYWSGRVIDPNCPNRLGTCTTDYVFPVEANLGVNKANYFVNRSYNLKTEISENGIINHEIQIRWKNDSPADTFPGGSYRNYFQLFLPLGTTIDKITKDGVFVEKYDQQLDEFKRIGFVIEIKPKTISEIKVRYHLAEKIAIGTSTLQLIIQKQTGNSNSDFTLQIILPTNIHILNHNFSALVKDREILYNTSLSADKVFFIEMAKEK